MRKKPERINKWLWRQVWRRQSFFADSENTPCDTFKTTQTCRKQWFLLACGLLWHL